MISVFCNKKSFFVLLLLVSRATAQTNTDTTRQWGKDTVKLKEVVIKATRKIYFEQQLDRVIINVHALPSNAGIHAVDVLNNTPGLMVNENGNISIKGKEPALVYIDDKPSYLTGKELLNFLQSLPSGMLDKIEIMANPPARYSAAGSAGIILIRTKKNNLYGFNGSLTLNYGQGVYPRSNSSFTLNYKKGKLNLYSTVDYSLQKNYYDVVRDRIYRFPNSMMDYSIYQYIAEHSQRDGFTYKMGIDIDLTKRTVTGFSFKTFTSPYTESGSYANIFSSGKTDSTIYSSSSLYTHYRNRSFNGYLLHRFRQRGRELNLNADYLAVNNQSNQSISSNTLLPSNSWQNSNTLFSSNPFTVHIYSVNADFTTPVSATLKLDAGLQHTYSKRTSIGDYLEQTGAGLHPATGLNNVFRFNENISAAYISLRKEYKRWLWQLGLRMENTAATALSSLPGKPDSSFTIRYADLFPTAYLQYRLDSNARQSIGFSFGKRITRPSYQDYNPSIFFFNRYTYTTGNSLLQPQYSYNAELSYTHGRLLALGLAYSRTFSIMTQAYKQVNDALITTMQNIDESTSLGLNLTSSLSLTRYWTLNLYQELTNIHYKGLLFSGEDYLDKNLTGYRLTASQQLSFGKGWGADISFVYRTNILYGQAIIKSAWQVHAGLQKKCSERASLTLSARDIFRSWVFEREIRIPYATLHSTNRNETRFVSLTFNYRFGGNTATRERKSGIQSEAGRAGAGN